MAFMDNTLSFNTSWTSSQAVSATAASTTIVDITGAGSGNAPAMINGFPASNTAIGEDYGAGDGVAIPYLYLTVVTAGTGAGTCTIQIQAAPDNGSYSPDTYYTIYQSAAFVGTTLKKGTVILVPLPPVPNNADNTSGGIDDKLPRFYRLNYVVASTFTCTFNAGLMLNPPSSLLSIQYNNNFVVV